MPKPSDILLCTFAPTNKSHDNNNFSTKPGASTQIRLVPLKNLLAENKTSLTLDQLPRPSLKRKAQTPPDMMMEVQGLFTDEPLDLSMSSDKTV